MTTIKKVEQWMEQSGFLSGQACYYQLPPATLVEAAVKAGEGLLSQSGALSVTTGKYTGRSPQDRFFVDTPSLHDAIDWGETNKPISMAVFESLWHKAQQFVKAKPLYVFDGYAGADEHYALSVRFINTLASQNLFVHQLFIRPSASQLQHFEPEFTVLSCPDLKLDGAKDGVNSEAAVLIDLEHHRILVAGTLYSGEMKKSIFTSLNFLMPTRDVFPMHCSANVNAKTGESALFFGLSGTGKTTLSADASRVLIGDDEHGWSAEGVFNFEGGCYAKAIRLSKKHEPEIWDAIKFGALVENVVMDPSTREFNYDDDSLTENTRVGYPVHYIPNSSESGRCGHPNTVIFLTADAFGVVPAISKLTPEQAQYHFMSGYTSKVAGTERGITEPKAVFSACFGAPFMPRPAVEYARLLKKRLEEHQAQVYWINTGWQGGPYGVGQRISLPYTRAMVNAALSGALNDVETEHHPVLNVAVPVHCPGVPDEVLNPRAQWNDLNVYDVAVNQLASMFEFNFAQFQYGQELTQWGPTSLSRVSR